MWLLEKVEGDPLHGEGKLDYSERLKGKYN